MLEDILDIVVETRRSIRWIGEVCEEFITERKSQPRVTFRSLESEKEGFLLRVVRMLQTQRFENDTRHLFYKPLSPWHISIAVPPSFLSFPLVIPPPWIAVASALYVQGIALGECGRNLSTMLERLRGRRRWWRCGRFRGRSGLGREGRSNWMWKERVSK